MAEDDPPQKSFRDRLAMFNQPKAAAAPPKPAVKPKAFKWKTSSEQADAGTSTAAATTTDADTSGKVVNVADIPPAAPTPTPGASAAGTDDLITPSSPAPQASTPNPSAPNPASPSTSRSALAPRDAESSGMSAADAKQKAGSLKDRIALLAGLKVEQPGVPGSRPLRPWKKPVAVPEQEGASASTEGDEITSGIDEANASTNVTAGQNAAEMPPDSPTDNLAKALEAPPATIQGDSAQGGVALPAMPTRARGPPRKGRSGGAATSAGSASKADPADSVAPVAEPVDVAAQLAPQPPEDAALDNHYAAAGNVSTEAPSLRDIASPATEPSQSQLMASAADQHDAGGAEVLEAETAAEDGYREPVTVSSERRPASVPPKQGDDDEDWGDKRSDDEDDDLAGVKDRAQVAAEERLAQLTLEGSSEDRVSIHSRQSTQSVGETANSQVSPKRSAPPLLSMTSSLGRSSGSDMRQADSPITSPTLTNRRSMTRPPVPGGFNREASTSSSPRPSLDGNRISFDIARSRPDSPMRSMSSLHSHQTDSAASSHGPEEGDGPRSATASPTVASKPPLPSITSPPMPTRKPTLPAVPISSPTIRSAPPLPSPTGRAPSRSNTASETGADETNISAAMQSRVDVPGNEDAEGEGDEYEDPEVARRQALAKRMAAIGGMKIGMLPMFGGAAKKKKATLPAEEMPDKGIGVEDPPAPAPSRAAPDVMSPVDEDAPAAMPSPVRQRSFLPPPGAFVLPGLGKPTAPTPEEAIAKDEAQDEHERDAEELEEQQDDVDVDEDEEDVEPDAANTPTANSSMQANIATPPPLPGGRPARPPPLADSSFIDTDTDTDGLASSGSGRTNSLASSRLGSLSAFPEPPAQGRHTRMPSNLSEMAYAAEDEQEDDQVEYLQQDDDERQRESSTGDISMAAPPPRSSDSDGDDDEMADLPAPPAPPGRPAPVIDTSYVHAEPDSVRSPSSFEASPARSIPSQPLAPAHNRQNSLTQAVPPSPSTSSDGRRSSTLPPMPTQEGQLTSAYLAQLATNAMRSKQREIDGPLATAINDIANGYRADPAGFGTVVYRYLVRDKGNPPDLHILGRIEPGTIMLAWDAKFDKGLGRSSLRIGSSTVPHVAIVGEEVRDMKKVKFRVVELARGSHVIEEYKIDNLKNGMVEIRRL